MNRRGIFQLELVAALTLIGGVCLVSLLALSTIERSKAEQYSPIPGSEIQVIDHNPSEPPHYVGIAAGGCAAANCHGGQNDNAQPGGEWKTSAFVFLQHDPHAQAYNVLFEDRSRQLIDRLAHWETTPDGGRPAPQEARGIKWYIAQLQDKCVSCHATPLPEGTASNAEAGLNHYALGVTCEACHGPASQWGDQHLSAHWQTSSSGELKNPINKKSTGFNELAELSTAAAACAKCHIGDGSQVDGRSYREVTHDLIAAGHPRLDFDFAAWYASMPPHWNREREKREGFNTQAWWDGQLAALDTREKLVAARVTATGNTAGSNANPRQPWPELAHFDCYACHQALRFPPENSVAEPRFAVSERDGKFDMVTLPLPFGSSWKAYGDVNPEVEMRDLQLTELLALRRKTFETMSLAEVPPPHAVAAKLAEFPAAKAPLRTFDELLSWYYAADAVSRDAAFAAQSSPDLQLPAKTMEASLQSLKSEMEKHLARSGKVSRYASPSGFAVAKLDADGTEKPDPQAVQTAFEEAKQALRLLAEKWDQ